MCSLKNKFDLHLNFLNVFRFTWNDQINEQTIYEYRDLQS